MLERWRRHQGRAGGENDTLRCPYPPQAHLVRVAWEEAVLIEQVVDHARKHLLLVCVGAAFKRLQQLHHLQEGEGVGGGGCSAQQAQLGLPPWAGDVVGQPSNDAGGDDAEGPWAVGWPNAAAAFRDSQQPPA